MNRFSDKKILECFRMKTKYNGRTTLHFSRNPTFSLLKITTTPSIINIKRQAKVNLKHLLSFDGNTPINTSNLVYTFTLTKHSPPQ